MIDTEYKVLVRYRPDRRRSTQNWQIQYITKRKIISDDKNDDKQIRNMAVTFFSVIVERHGEGDQSKQQ